MSRATPETRSYSKRILFFEGKRIESSGKKTPAIFQVFTLLSEDLIPLMGIGGYRSLLSRSVAVASEEIQWLSAVHVKSDGSLESLVELQSQLDPDDFLEGSIVLFAELIGLLGTFIGETLMLQLVAEIWPDIRPSE